MEISEMMKKYPPLLTNPLLIEGPFGKMLLENDPGFRGIVVRAETDIPDYEHERPYSN